jgi:hypothetical protein
MRTLNLEKHRVLGLLSLRSVVEFEGEAALGNAQ